MWLDMRTEEWGQRETQEYYRQMFGTLDISVENAKNILDKDLSIVDNIDMRRLRAIRKQLTQEIVP